jgi:hypothetical protein
MDVIEGKPRPPSKDKEYVPPNSAVCHACWQHVPTTEHIIKAADALDDATVVFGYASADSSNSPIWGSKQWSNIETTDTYVFIQRKVVDKYLPQVLPIIAQDAEHKQWCAATLLGCS